MRRLVMDDELFDVTATDEDERRILDPLVDEIGERDKRERAPAIGPVRRRVGPESFNGPAGDRLRVDARPGRRNLHGHRLRQTDDTPEEVEACDADPDVANGGRSPFVLRDLRSRSDRLHAAGYVDVDVVVRGR